MGSSHGRDPLKHFRCQQLFRSIRSGLHHGCGERLSVVHAVSPEEEIMRMRVARFSGIIVAAVLTLGSTRTAGAQQTVKLGAGDTLTISGFINATMHNNRGL